MAESFASLCAIALVLTVIDGKPTTSLDIARHFGKRHTHIMDAIRALLEQLPPEHQPNFRPMFVEVTLGQGATRQDPAYRITRDGFTLLAMGFTGKKALQFKLAYIDAFNRMEAEIADLRNSANPAPLPPKPRAMGFPDSYRLPERAKDAMHMLGNAVCPPVARDVINAIMEVA